MNEINDFQSHSGSFDPRVRQKLTNVAGEQAIIPDVSLDLRKFPNSETLQAMMGVIVDKANQLTAKFAISGKLGFHDIKALRHTIKGGNEEAEVAAMLLTLVDEKKVNPRTLRYFCKNGVISDAMEKDIRMIFRARAMGQNPNDEYIPTVENSAEGITNTEIGDLFEVKGQKNIYIKAKEDTAEQLKMDKETMIKLFPPAERFANAQTYSGDCYFVATVNSMMENPKTRAHFLKCFEQDGDDVIIRFPNNDFKYVAEDGQMPKSYKHNFLTGSTGMKLIEFAYGQFLENTISQQAIEMQLDAIKTLEEKIEQGATKENLQDLEEKLKRHKNNLERFEKDQKNKTKEYVVALDDYRKPEMNMNEGISLRPISQMNFYRSTTFETPGDFYRGDGGVMEDVFMDFGYKTAKGYSMDDPFIRDLLRDPERFQDYIFTGGTKREGRSNLLRRELIMDRSISMFGAHAYKIQPSVTKDNEIVYKVSNSWNSSHNCILTFEQLEQFFSQIHIAKIDDDL